MCGSRVSIFAVSLLAILLPTRPVAAENWSQFRGPNGGVVKDANLPVEWTKDKLVLWKASIPGIAWSQPVVWGDKVFITTAVTDQPTKPNPLEGGPGISRFEIFFGASQKPPEVNYQWKLLCLDAATGNVVWEKTAREGRPTIRIHLNNTYASETPVTDGERVIAYFGMAGVYCYDLDGNLLWEKDLGAYPMQFGWGTGSSPLLFEDYVYIQCDNDKESFLVALDKESGEQVWRTPREEKSNWSTPYIWKNSVRTELVTAGGSQMRSYDPKSGELLWSMKSSGRTATTPVAANELLYVDSYDRLTGGSGTLAAIRPGASGDISLSGKETASDHVAWSLRLRGQRVASPLVCNDCLYVLEQNSGIVRCLDAQSGEEHYRQRLPGARGFTASPIGNGNKVYCIDQNGMTTVLEAGSEFNAIATSELGEMCWASPAVVGDRLLIRTLDHLYCIGSQ